MKRSNRHQGHCISKPQRGRQSFDLVSFNLIMELAQREGILTSIVYHIE